MFEIEVIWMKNGVRVSKYVALDAETIEEMAKHDMDEGILEAIKGTIPGVHLL